MHELESLEHVVWSSALTSEHWSQLSLFTRLRTIHIGAVSTELEEQDRVSLKLDAPLLSLQSCSLLSSVSLTGVDYPGCYLSLSTEHAALLAALPRLQSLFLRDVKLQSLAPLTSAPALTHLMMDNCRGVTDAPFSMRAAVPHLPLLTSLTIECDHEEGDRSAHPEQYAAVTAAMVQRLPMMRPESFRHQSWSTNCIGRRSAPRSAGKEWRPAVLRI